jgi:hypothetical protein
VRCIKDKVELELEGYIDIFSYEQNDYKKTVKERNWWRKKEFNNVQLVYNDCQEEWDKDE